MARKAIGDGVLEGTIVDIPFLRTSERSAFKRCWQRWEYGYRYGLNPRYRQADALWFGIGIHEALAAWYLPGYERGPHPADTFEEWAGNEVAVVKTYLGDNYDEAVWVDAIELGIGMLTEYVNTYEWDDQWEIIAIEEPFKVRLHYKGKPVALFCSRWDGVARDRRTRKIVLLEHKTAGHIQTLHLDGDDQAMSYLAVANQVLRARKVLKPGENIAGIQYNFLRKALKDERPQDENGYYTNKPTREHYVQAFREVGIRTVEQGGPKSGPVPIDKAKLGDLEIAAKFAQIRVLGEVSKSQPPPYFLRPDPILRTPAEMRNQLIRMAEEVYVMNQVRAKRLPVMKSRTRDCPYCDFWDMCLLSDRGDDSWKEIRDASYVVKDPYADIRADQIIKSAAE